MSSTRSWPPTILVHAYQPLWHVAHYDLYHGFTSVHHTDYLGLTRMRFPGGSVPHSLLPVPEHFGTLSRSLLIQTGRFIWQNRWFSPCFQGKTTLKSDFVSQTHLALWGDVSGSEQRQFLKKVRANQKKMKKWARHAPMNFLHKWQLVETERARVLEKNRDAMELYDTTIEGARTHGYVNEEALANELAARFYRAKGRIPIARTYLQAARSCYLAWGAQAKVQHLSENYAKLLAVQDGRHLEGGAHLVQRTTTKTHPNGTTSQTLDLSTIMKASQTISSEMVLADLLKKMMQIMIENAGAQKGVLLLEHDGTWWIEAEGMVGNDGLHLTSGVHLNDRDGLYLTSGVHLNDPRAQDGRHLEGGAHHSVPLKSSTSALATTIVHYVARTQQAVMLNDAAHEGDFTDDPYISSQQPQSIFCLPLLHQGKLTGILYLENDLASGTFTPDRVEVLKLLSSQMAISIENARLYTDLSQSEQKYRTLFEDSKDAIFITTPGGVFVDVNQACLDLLGVSRADILTTQLIELYVNPTDHRRFLEIMAQEGTVRDFEATLRKTDGIYMECLLTVTVRRSHEGKILAYQGIVRDITARKKAEDLLKNFTKTLQQEVEQRTQELNIAREQALKAKEAAETANRAKSNFLANMSHELRTPLNVILGFAQLITYNQAVPREEQENLGVIRRSGEHLLTLINQVFDLSKIEAGHLTLNETDFDLYRLLDDLEDLFSLRAKHKGLSLRVERAPELPRYVHADEVKLRQVLINLLSNAIKFTKEGEIQLSVNSKQLSVPPEELITDHCLLFTIKDTGSGIAPEEMEKLFEAFAQTETGRRAQEGTGLGLPISRKFVQLMGGDIQVIFLSALSEVFDKVKAFSVGGVDYLTKLVQHEEALARIKTHLTIRKLQQQLQEQNARLEE